VDRTYNTSLQGLTTIWPKRNDQYLTPDYGYSATYEGAIRMFSYGDGFYAISPKGVNNITFSLSLNYSNLHDAEARQIIDFLETSKGLDFPFVPPDPFCKKNIFRCVGFSHTFNKENLNNISINLKTNKQSSLNIESAIPGASETLLNAPRATDAHTMYLSINSDDVSNFLPSNSAEHYKNYSDYCKIGYKEYLRSIFTREEMIKVLNNDFIDGIFSLPWNTMGLIERTALDTYGRPDSTNDVRSIHPGYYDPPSSTDNNSKPFEIRVVPWTQSFGYHTPDDTLYATSTYVINGLKYLSQWAYPKDIVVFKPDYEAQTFDKYYYCKKSHFARPSNSPFNNWLEGGNLDGGTGVWVDSNKIPGSTNETHWTKNFFWEPSYTSSISQQSRILSKVYDGEKVEVLSDGRNANPLVFDVQFNNRDDREAYAILHFLENRKGYVRFKWDSVPGIYDVTDRYFVCNSWSFSKRYIDNNSIKATFIEDALGADLGY
jgi:phage-related protein